MMWVVGFAGAALLLGIATLFRHMRRIEPERVEIVHKTIVSEALPPELDGLVICQVSDLHITAHPRNGAAVADAIRSVQADLYVLTGDLIHGAAGGAALMSWLDEMGDRLRPAVAVFGNAEHKRLVNPNSLRRQLEQRGIRVLVNETAEIPVARGSIHVVGLDDPHSGHSRATVAYAHADPERWTLVLVHSPEGVLELEGRRADLVLAGHTHGGQIVLPGIGWISDNTHNRLGLISGFYSEGDLMVAAGLRRGPKALYVSRGLGTSGWPLRLRCRPELPMLTLRRPNNASPDG